MRRIDEQAAAAEQTLSRSLVSLVEVLGLFVALIGFLGAGAVTVFQGQSAGEKILTLVLLLIGSVGFFLTLRAVVSRPARPRGRRRSDSTGDR
jgi:flagellar biogenesis protein FliO